MRWMTCWLLVASVGSSCNGEVDPDPDEIRCNDGICQWQQGESCSTCQSDCGPCPSVCGDTDCTGQENCSSCPQDCGPCTNPDEDPAWAQFQQQAGGNTYYAAPDGTAGNAGTEASPWSFSHAVDQLGPGDTLLLLDGRYLIGSKVNLVGVAGTQDNWIHVTSKNPHGAVVVPTSNDYAIQLTGQNTHHVKISALEVSQYEYNTTQNKYHSYGILALDGAHHIIVENCHVHHVGGNGIAMAYGDYFMAKNNIVHHTSYWAPEQTHAFTAYEPTNLDTAPGFHIVFKNNIAFAAENRVLTGEGITTDGNGLLIDDAKQTQGNCGCPPFTSEILVENNIMFFNGRCGVGTFVSDNVTFRNNTAVWNNMTTFGEAGYGTRGNISVSWAGNTKVYNNIAVANLELHPDNTAYLELGDDAYNAGNVYYDNLSFNGTDGEESFNRHDGSNGNVPHNRFPTSQGNLPGTNPQFNDQFDRSELDAFLAQTDVSAPDRSLIRSFAARLQLQASSPAVDQGNSGNASAADILGVSRPQGGGTDMGAFER